MPRSAKFDDDVILRRAMNEFWRTGWAGTSIRDLEIALELTAPSIYRKFGSKEGLFIACVDHYVQHVVEVRIGRYLATDSDDPLGGLQGFCASALDAGKATRYQGCLLTLSANEAPGLPPTARRAVMAGIERIRSAVVAATVRAAEHGQIDLPDAEATGDQVAIAMQGLLVISRGGVSRPDVQRQAKHALAVIHPD